MYLKIINSINQLLHNFTGIELKAVHNQDVTYILSFRKSKERKNDTILLLIIDVIKNIISS